MRHEIVWVAFFSIVLVMVLGVYFFKPERIHDHPLHRCSLGLLVIAFGLQVLLPVLAETYLKSPMPSVEQTERRARLCGGCSVAANYGLVILALYLGLAATRPERPEEPKVE